MASKQQKKKREKFWTRERDDKLIDLFESAEILWNKESEEYKLGREKPAAWGNIARLMQTSGKKTSSANISIYFDDNSMLCAL